MRLNHLSYTVSFLAGLLISSSCLPLVKSEPFDDNGNWLSEYTLVQWLASSENKDYTIYYKAAGHCGLVDEIESSEDKTFIIPSDEAFETLLSSLNIADITDIPSAVLYDFMKYLVIPVEVRSTELEPDKVYPYITESVKPIYITRSNAGSNPYLLQVNVKLPDGNTTFGGASATVSMQDATFSDNIAQMVDAVPYFAPKVSATETFTGKLEADNISRIGVNIDTYIYRHDYPAVQADKKILANTKRVPVIWYENPDISFADDIRSAKVYFYLSDMTGVVTTEFTLHDISSQLWELTGQGTVNGNLLNAIYATFDPVLNLDNSITNIKAGNIGAWFSADITEFIRQRYASSDRLPIGLSMYPVTAFSVDYALVLGYKQESNGLNHNQSYIEVMGKVLTKSVLSRNDRFVCPPKSFVQIDDEGLLREKGPSAGSLRLTPNNILYSVSEAPKYGVLVRNGLPLKEGITFTQAEIDAGAVRYYNIFSATSDSFVLSGGDYTGSIMDEDITVNIDIQ